MARPTEELLARIQKLVSDPRYLNKKHPQHPRLFAEATRAFEDAYREPAPESDTTEGNVHVRAYTRIVDGKEVQVSEYDRTQQIAFRPGVKIPNTRDGLLHEVIEGPAHKNAKQWLVDQARARGDIVATEIPLLSVGTQVPTRIDFLAMSADRSFWYGIDVKTYAYNKFGPNQLYVWWLLHLGGHVYSPSPRMLQFGHMPGQPLPPICFYRVYVPEHGPMDMKRMSPDPSCPPGNLDLDFLPD